MFAAKDMFESFGPHRKDSVVIVTGTCGRHWRDVSTNEARDLPLGGAMGHTTSASLGLALAQPDEKVVLFDSEGSLLMNMGILATIAGQKPSNFVHFLMDNECYATTGGQPVPNAQDIDYAGMAREAGYTAAYSFDNLEDFATNVGKIMTEPGPVFVSMKMVPEVENEPIGRRQRRAARPRVQAIRELQESLGVPVSI